jgi:poly(3-hydroxybutyrate) depolymerase
MVKLMHRPSVRSSVLLLLLAGVPAISAAQALPGISSLRVAYNTRKATAHPQGDVKIQIDAVDNAIAEAAKTGNLGEVRRQLAKGMTLLTGAPWTPAVDYQNSLVLRSERTVVDPSAPYVLRLEQIYRPDITLTPALSVRVALRPRQDPPQPGMVAAQVMVPAREMGTFDGVSRDLRESPFPIELDLSSVPDGPFVVEATAVDGEQTLGTVRLGILVHKGLDARLRALASAATAGVSEALRAEVLYPVDFIANINRGRVRIGNFDVANELKAAEAVLAAAQAGKDPFKGRTGDMERHYVLPGANEVMPYRVYVPTTYTGTAAAPLVIALHGLGANEDSFFDAYAKQPVALAEKHGFLMAAPLGYRVDGFYGSGVSASSDAAVRRRLTFSEQDVLEVVRLMKTIYKVDDGRVYLIGHSMGAIGTWHLGSKYPDIWAALAPFSGMGSPVLAERMRSIPQIVVHGDADPTVSVEGSRAMVAELKRLGADVTYIEVPGGNHMDVVVPNLPKVFEFLAAHRKAGPAGLR